MWIFIVGNITWELLSLSCFLLTEGGYIIHAGKISWENNERVSFVVTSSTVSKHTTFKGKVISYFDKDCTLKLQLILSIFSSRDY